MPFPGISGAPLLIKPPSGLRVQDVFNISIWTGSGAARTITTGIDSGKGSLVWIKSRSLATNHSLFDTVRGSGNSLSSNLADAQSSGAGGQTAFSSSGYSLDATSTTNSSGNTYVGWQFRSAENFFDIVQYTGTGAAGLTIPHNLGVKPGMILVKRMDSSANWQVYHQARAATRYGVLNTTATFATAATRWNNTEPTESVFTLGSVDTVNANGGSYIAYLFAHDTSPKGIIQCGSYVGNGTSTGPFVNLGWRPQYVMIKRSSVIADDWFIFDAARGITSGSDQVLLANSSAVESNADYISTEPTGIQIGSTATINTGSAEYIYMAIREA